ncbi:MAG: glycine/sarcosine/betaine reductase complex component C subunit beta [Acidimicrobiia bacterium]
MHDPSILASSYVLAHGPDLIRHGSKPTRELAVEPGLLDEMSAAVRSWDEVIRYAPNQVFIGNVTPEELGQIPRPWYGHPLADASSTGSFGRIVPQEALYGLMKLCDDFGLISISEDLAAAAGAALDGFDHRIDRIDGTPHEVLTKLRDNGGGLPLFQRGSLAGFVRTAYEGDPSLDAHVLLENLVCKATAVLAVSDLLVARSIDPSEVGYLLNTGEEAVGDRYQRGGGNMAKAVGEVVGCVNATGSDIKAFCAAPVHALIIASAMVKAGLHKYIVVFGGASQAKLGMKFRAHLRNGVPLMEDVLAGMAFLVGPDDGDGMLVRLDMTGRHPIGAGSSPQAIYESLVVAPLQQQGLRLGDIDRYAVELHNPEITEPGDSGNVPLTNYQTLAAMAVRRGEISREEMRRFVAEHGMPGFAPTQGHIPAGVPYLGHAHAAMRRGELSNAMVVAKGSLFLGRMTQLVDGMSFVVEPSPSMRKKQM